MNSTLEMIAIFVSVIGGFKALEYVIGKITRTHDKSKQIDANTEEFKAYKLETDAKIISLQTQLANAHQYAQSSLDGLKNEIVKTLDEHRQEYIKGIDEVKASVIELSSLHQQNTAILEIKIDNLEKSNVEHLEKLKQAQNKHNNLMERTFICEKEISVLQNREKVSEHRLDDLEKKND